MLTGDNELVTAKVCHDVGFTIGGGEEVITGKQLAALGPEAFLKTNPGARDVFAHLTPDQKEAIIKGLRSSGHVVGFMGDGINDAAALKAADVGISVDTAVDVAKESADIILLEKNLLVLEDGIIEGRKTFNNILKYIKMGASSNFGNMFSVIGASYLFPFLPMQPVQILLNNLLYDLSQTAIPLMTAVSIPNLPPGRKHGISALFAGSWSLSVPSAPSSIVVRHLRSDVVLLPVLTGIFFWHRRMNWRAYFQLIAKPGDPNTSYAAHLFNTAWFVESLLTQTLIVHIIRTNKVPFFQSRSSWPMTMTTLLVMAAGAVIPYTPIAQALVAWCRCRPSSGPSCLVYLVGYAVLTHPRENLVP